MLSFFTRGRAGRKLAVIVAVPAMVLGTAVAADAATHTLTLTLLTRSGAKVKTLAKAVSLTSSQEYAIRAGTARKLPAGSYAVLATIGRTTLGAGIVKVSGSSKLTLDARKGKQVAMRLSPAPTGVDHTLGVRICTRDESATSDVETYGSGEALYVIPNSSKYLAFAALGSWTDRSGVTDSFAAMRTTVGVPTSTTRTFARSALAPVQIDYKHGPAGSASGGVAVQPAADGCALNMYAGMSDTDRPTRSKLYLSAGKWDIRSGTWGTTKNGESWHMGESTATRTIVAGKTYNARFNNAAWGPSTQLPVVLNGRISFFMNDMFEDPEFPGRGSVEGGDKARATLVFGGKTVKITRDNGWEPEMTVLEYQTKKAGWYTLTNSASRYYPEVTYPAGMLSTQSSVVYRFYAKPKSYALPQVYAVQMRPLGLNLDNRAKLGTSTNVTLKLYRTSQDPDAKRGTNPVLKTLATKMSVDGGKTWKAVTVKKVNGAWTAVVPNPATSAAIALRTRATFTNGAYTEATIFRAYVAS